MGVRGLFGGMAADVLVVSYNYYSSKLYNANNPKVSVCSITTDIDAA